LSRILAKCRDRMTVGWVQPVLPDQFQQMIMREQTGGRLICAGQDDGHGSLHDQLPDLIVIKRGIGEGEIEWRHDQTPHVPTAAR